MYSDAQNKATQRYSRKAYDRIGINIKKGGLEAVKKVAKSKGMSVNAFIVSLIEKEVNLDEVATTQNRIVKLSDIGLDMRTYLAFTRQLCQTVDDVQRRIKRDSEGFKQAVGQKNYEKYCTALEKYLNPVSDEDEAPELPEPEPTVPQTDYSKIKIADLDLNIRTFLKFCRISIKTAADAERKSDELQKYEYQEYIQKLNEYKKKNGLQ